MADIRTHAVNIYQKSLSEKKFFEIESSGQTAYLNMLLLTAARNRVFIETILRQFIRRPVPRKNIFAFYALLLGSTELLFMNTPPHAAINGWVETVKKQCDKFLGGMVNAVLRRISENRSDLLQQPRRFFPAEFLKILRQDYAPEQIAAMEQACFFEPPLAVSIKEAPEIWAQKLNGQQLSNNTLTIPAAGPVPSLPGYKEGAWWVQDFAASLAVTALAPCPGQKILDLCAAPGGKTAQLLNARAAVTALDCSQERLQTLHQNLTRLQFPLPEIICADAREWLQSAPKESFDAVLLDAPCSATGIFRRHPEILAFKTLDDVRRQTELQQQILTAAAPVIKHGGTLIYCVCSIAKDEGEKQITRFLKAHPEFCISPLTEREINSFHDGRLSSLLTAEGFIRTLPSMLPEFGGVDSFFIARLQKA